MPGIMAVPGNSYDLMTVARLSQTSEGTQGRADPFSWKVWLESLVA